MWIETPLDATRGAPASNITLLMRPAERVGGNQARVYEEPVKVALSLTTGIWAPLGELAECFVRDRQWLGAAIAEHLDKLRERVRRAAAQS
ncbi:MAG TPA: hypothetical protein VGJ91_07735, partial [Polyangiaceae bacterium]